MVPETDPELMVSDPKPEPKSTKYLFGRKFIYAKEPDPNGSYPNPIRISEVPSLGSIQISAIV